MDIYKPYKYKLKISNVGQTVNALIWLSKQPENIEAVKELAYIYHRYGASILFSVLKKLITYENDPKGIEYIQGAKALLISKKGDCDCFVSLTSSIMYATGTAFKIVLFGAGNEIPSHISIQIPERKNSDTLINFDLTAPAFNTLRKYRYWQLLPVQPN
jgi:hypothetical protein